MIIIGSGSREWKDYKPIKVVMSKIISRYGNDFTYYHGNARGYDTLCNIQLIALKHTGLRKPYQAAWNEFGKPAGMIRNRAMLADALINESPHDILLVAMPLENSIGTLGMISIARQAHINIEIYDQHGQQIDL